MEEQNALNEAAEPEVKEEKKEGEAEPITENQRLYVMNLSYQVTHDELKD